MNNRRLYIFLLITLAGILPVGASVKIPFSSYRVISASPVEISIDSVIKKQPVKKDGNKQKGQKGDAKKTEIKEVPKSKRQLKPAAVKTKIKTPVKRVKPVIKRPVKLIRKN